MCWHGYLQQLSLGHILLIIHFFASIILIALDVSNYQKNLGSKVFLRVSSNNNDKLHHGLWFDKSREEFIAKWLI